MKPLKHVHALVVDGQRAITSHVDSALDHFRAVPTRQNVLRVREAGTKFVLAKPFSTEELIDHVENMLRPLLSKAD